MVPGSDPEERDLVARVRAGDAEAFGRLVSRHLERAFAIAYRLLGHREDAEDLVQEAFLAALEKIDTFDETRSFGPWLRRIVVNRALNARTARARRRMEGIPEGTAAPGPSPLVEAERGELRGALARALDSLPERQRDIVRLAEMEGFSSVEIAEMMNLSDGTVRWHLHQARQTLRESLAPLARRES